METDGASNSTAGTISWWPFFPSNQAERQAWRLDVVTLLAVIGESSMSDHSQTITASAFCLLPRVLPAPQALLKPSRPIRMPLTTAKLTGVYSGVTLETVGFFANIIHPLDELQPFQFKVLKITHKEPNQAVGDISVNHATAAQRGTVSSRIKDLLRRTFGIHRSGNSSSNDGGSAAGANVDPNSKPRIPRSPSPKAGERSVDNKEVATFASSRTVTFASSSPDPENGGQPPQPQMGIRRRSSAKEKVTDFVNSPTLATTDERPAVPAALYSPVHFLSVFSMFLTVGMLVMAGYLSDGPAVLAVSLISAQSSLVGFASWWKPILMKRSHTNVVPKGDVMIRTREGAFLLIQCTEEVARELYTAGTEECQYYVSENPYRLLMGIGTMMLMFSTVLLGNCSFSLQLFVGMTYICLNGLYWAMGMFPKKYFWDLSRYNFEDVTPEDSREAHLKRDSTTGNPDPREDVPSFTRSLWYAIRETGLTGWVERSGAAPSTEQWKAWLKEAEINARKRNRKWPAVGRKDAIINPHQQSTAAAGRPTTDAPADNKGATEKQRRPSTTAGAGGNEEPIAPAPGAPSGPVGPGAPDPGKQHAPLTEVEVQDNPARYPPGKF